MYGAFSVEVRPMIALWVAKRMLKNSGDVMFFQAENVYAPHDMTILITDGLPISHYRLSVLRYASNLFRPSKRSVS